MRIVVVEKSKISSNDLFSNFFSKNSLDAGIQDSSTSISIVVKFEEMSELDGDESDKRI